MASLVAVTGGNGFVGSRVCEALVERGVRVRAVVRRPGTATSLEGVEELVGDFTDPDVAATLVDGADAVVTTVHPMGSDRETQARIGVEGTATVARAASGAGVQRLVHISTAAVYDRSPGVGDVDDSSALVGDGAGAYAVTKRDADLAIAEVSGLTRVLLRPPAILGAGPTSVWNTLRPTEMRDDERARTTVPDAAFNWVHVDDLADLTADLAVGRIPAPEGCTAVNVCAGAGSHRDYYETVARAVGVEPVWTDGPAWTGRILATRARAWGWVPGVDLTRALAEIEAGWA